MKLKIDCFFLFAAGIIPHLSLCVRPSRLVEIMLVGYLIARHLSMGLGYMYPLYASVEALRTRREEDLLQWITFWTINAFFWVVETVGDTISAWLPFYLEAKIVALAWLVLPTFSGALLLHQHWVAPAFQQHEKAIDSTIADLKRRAVEKMVRLGKDSLVLALQNSTEIVAQSEQNLATHFIQLALGKLQSTVTLFPAPQEDTRLPTLPPTIATKSVDEVTAEATIQVKSDNVTEEMKIETIMSDVWEKKQLESVKQELCDFKTLMMKGFQLRYHPTAGVVKSRVLVLESAHSRYVSFLSAKDFKSLDNTKKAARLLHSNLRRVSTSVALECEGFAKMVEEDQIQATHAFFIDNGKAVMLFEAESPQRRDVLVKGLRQLIKSHRKHDTMALTKLCSAIETSFLHQAFTRLQFNTVAQ